MLVKEAPNHKATAPDYEATADIYLGFIPAERIRLLWNKIISKYDNSYHFRTNEKPCNKTIIYHALTSRASAMWFGYMIMALMMKYNANRHDAVSSVQLRKKITIIMLVI